MKRNSWYDYLRKIPDGDVTLEFLRESVSQEDIQESVGKIIQLIEEEVRLLNGRHDKVYIGGMSQGVTVALSAFL